MKLLTCDAHVTRFAARGQLPAAARQTYRKAVEKFRAAADVDPQSYDPYLGISRILVYGLGEVDEAAAAVNEAEKRGYVPGRRERAQLGDGYLRRANARRNLAHTLSGDQRRRELENARGDYARCIETFDPIVGFGRAAANLEICKRQLEKVTAELETEGERP
jgi:tetratricopeptide (TPR) repeat protein